MTRLALGAKWSPPDDFDVAALAMISKVPLRDRRVIGVDGFSCQVDRIQAYSGTVDAFTNVIAYLHEHFAEYLVSDDLARMAGLSLSHFERRLRRAVGASPRHYLLRIRVEHGSQLLLETDQTVSEIAQRCGFHDHAHLSRSFRRIIKQSPSEYRAG